MDLVAITSDTILLKSLVVIRSISSFSLIPAGVLLMTGSELIMVLVVFIIVSISMSLLIGCDDCPAIK